MKKKWSFLLLATVFVILIGGAYALYERYQGLTDQDRLVAEENSHGEIEEGETQEESAEPETVPAPDFTVYDKDGNAVKFSDLTGKPVVLNFWASWCNPCRMEMPEFQTAFEELGEEITFVMINMTDGAQETLETAQNFLEETGYSFPVYYDTEMNGAMTYGVTSLPRTFFIDAKGNLVAHATGAIDAEVLDTGIGMIIEEVPAE